LEIYLVGGAVRDQLLNRVVKEKDWVVVGATPQEMLDKGYKQVGKDFPVFIHPKTGEEYALARTERKTGKGYTGFDCYAAPDVTLEDDLKRRDLTINAIAQDQAGNLIDPHGGQEDLKKRILKHVSDAFVEDPLRVLRIARFAARFSEFKVADETAVLLKAMVKQGELNELVPERVWKEFETGLNEDNPQRFFEVLRANGALKILFPEIDNLFGIPNPPAWHPEIDTGVHTMMVLTQAAKLHANTTIRFATLMHDIGKAITDKNDWPSHKDHGNKGATLIKAFSKRFPVPKHFQELAIIVAKYHTHCHKILEMKANTILQTLEKLDAFRRPDRFEEFLTACDADAKGRPGFEDRDYPQKEFFKKCLEAANAVDVKPLIESGLQGSAIADKLHSRRVTAIKEIL